uniref:Uncharacterized protein n=1 Tax=Arundo donax TaxID=35708 RepID=A0A0A9E5Q0_ARUDO
METIKDECQSIDWLTRTDKLKYKLILEKRTLI